MPNYPTKEKIMEKEVKFKPEVIMAIKDWKKTDWTINKTDNTHLSLYRLLSKLAIIYDKQDLCITNQPVFSHYNIKTHTINLENNSIVTALHEFAHHIFGPSELQACRWSIWLFKKTFPNSFQKLKWDGHMIKKIIN
jgi:hypothetical protein